MVFQCGVYIVYECISMNRYFAHKYIEKLFGTIFVSEKLDTNIETRG